MKYSKTFFSKLTASILAVLIIITCVLSVSAEVFCVTDINGTEYEITQNADEITIKNPKGTVALPFYTHLVDCSVYDDIVTLYSYKSISDNKFNYCIYFYNTFDGDYVSVDAPYRVSVEKYVCTADKNMSVFMRDYADERLVYEYTNQRKTYEYKTNTPVLQMLCIRGTDIYLITADGVYCIKNHQINKIGDYILSIPSTHTFDTITDYIGNVYDISDGGILPVVNETEPDTPSQPSSDYVEIQINSDSFILSGSTTFAQLYRSLGVEKSELTVYKTDGKILSTGRLGTGMTAVYNDQKYLINIIGDITGEGNVNSRDLKLMMKILSGEETLSDDIFLSADLNKDGILNTKDLLKLSQMY